MHAEYLKEAVGKYLCQALCAVAIRRPERPIEFLAYYLISLYEKDLEMQRLEEAKKAAEQKEEEEKSEAPSFTPEVSQMFIERLSISHSQAAERSHSTSSASAVDSEVLPEISDMFKGRLSIFVPQERDSIPLLPIPSVVVSDESKSFETHEKTEESLASADSNEASSLLKPPSKESFAIPEESRKSITSSDLRKPSLLLDDTNEILRSRRISSVVEPLTEEEAEEFGTTDPFLARRPTNVFDVSGSPIGNL